jgi:hypothetical protein
MEVPMSRKDSTENSKELDRVTLREFVSGVLDDTPDVPESLAEGMVELAEGNDGKRPGKIRKLIEEASRE